MPIFKAFLTIYLFLENRKKKVMGDGKNKKNRKDRRDIKKSF